MKKTLFIAAALAAGVAFAATPPPTTTQTAPTVDDAPITAAIPGKIKKCTGCHGKDLMGKKKAPKIANLGAAKIKTALGHGIAADKIAENIKPAGKIAKRMKGVAKKLTDSQKAALAAWIAKCAETGCATE